ncbi:MAG: hypothetical protein JEZ03_03990 [Bacteroidales bacterium]|nr:hypothetical protein [Bacteroidales bacterium]
MTTKSINIIFAFLILSPISLMAQNLNMDMDPTFGYEQLKSVYEKGSHTVVYPLMEKDVPHYDSLKALAPRYQKKSGNRYKQFVTDKVFNEPLLDVQKKNYSLEFNPLINFGMGKEFSDEQNTYINTRGFEAKVNINNTIAFYTSFYENQAVFPNYMEEYIRQNRVIPGQGYRRDFGDNGFDYAHSNGYVSIPATRFFNIQFGHGKHFWGDGHRSLLLSDNSFNYPYLRIVTDIWKIRYVNLFAQFQDLSVPHSYALGYQKKYGSFHYLDYAITDNLKFGVFEAIIWQAEDSTGQRGFDINYLNPVIFYRPVEFSVGSPDNALMGANLSWSPIKGTTLYGQLLLDEFKFSEMKSGDGWWANKQAVQVGVKSFDVGGVENLFLQAEYNYVRPYTYSHFSTLQNYGHYNQSLAHPFGANFREYLAIARYSRNRLFLDLKLIYAQYGLDPNGKNYGKDIYKDYNTHENDYGNKTGQGLETDLIFADLQCSYLINPAYNLNLYLGVTYRNESNIDWNKETSYVYGGIRTSIGRAYYDF